MDFESLEMAAQILREAPFRRSAYAVPAVAKTDANPGQPAGIIVLSNRGDSRWFRDDLSPGGNAHDLANDIDNVLERYSDAEWRRKEEA